MARVHHLRPRGAAGPADPSASAGVSRETGSLPLPPRPLRGGVENPGFGTPGRQATLFRNCGNSRRFRMLGGSQQLFLSFIRNNVTVRVSVTVAAHGAGPAVASQCVWPASPRGDRPAPLTVVCRQATRAVVWGSQQENSHSPGPSSSSPSRPFLKGIALERKAEKKEGHVSGRRIFPSAWTLQLPGPEQT